MTMEIIPKITLKKRKMIADNEEIITAEKLNNLVKKDDLIYFYDLDGINRDRPNLCLFQKVAKSNEMWIDSGPRVLGDVVDLVMAGAARITLRKKVWLNLDISSVKEITESKIFIGIDSLTNEINTFDISIFSEVDGYVYFGNKSDFERDFKLSIKLKNLCKNTRLYVCENSEKNIPYWENMGITGILMDIKKN